MKRIKYALISCLLLNILLSSMLFYQWKSNQIMLGYAFANFYHHLNSTAIYLNEYLDGKDTLYLARAHNTADAAMVEANILSPYFGDYSKDEIYSLSHYMNGFMTEIMSIEVNNPDHIRIRFYLEDINSLKEILLPVVSDPFKKDKATLKDFLRKAEEINKVDRRAQVDNYILSKMASKDDRFCLWIFNENNENGQEIDGDVKTLIQRHKEKVGLTATINNPLSGDSTNYSKLLSLNEYPTFILFDNNNIIFRTTKLEHLNEFLTSYSTP